MTANFEVIDQAENVILNSDSTTTTYYNVKFKTIPNGVTGSVQIPYSDSYADDVLATITPIATQLEAVASIGNQ